MRRAIPLITAAAALLLADAALAEDSGYSWTDEEADPAAPSDDDHAAPARTPSVRAPYAELGADRGLHFEISLSGQMLATTSSSVDPLIGQALLAGPRITASLGIDPTWAVHVGGSFFKDNPGSRAGIFPELDGWSILAGASARFPIVWRLHAVGIVDLEALSAEVEIEPGGARLGQRAWTFGAVPQVGLELDLPIAGDALSFRIRLVAGYAFRADLAFDGLTDADETTRPLDLGAANLSGVVFNGGVALRF